MSFYYLVLGGVLTPDHTSESLADGAVMPCSATFMYMPYPWSKTTRALCFMVGIIRWWPAFGLDRRQRVVEFHPHHLVSSSYPPCHPVWPLACTWPPLFTQLRELILPSGQYGGAGEGVGYREGLVSRIIYPSSFNVIRDWSDWSDWRNRSGWESLESRKGRR